MEKFKPTSSSDNNNRFGFGCRLDKKGLALSAKRVSRFHYQ
jgi:hypothetical protein